MTRKEHVLAAVVFSMFAVVWSFPLIRHLSTNIPGEGIADNASFVWNLWWMRHVLATAGEHFFFTTFLFAPFGVDLVLHTHTALQAFVGATVLGSLPPVAAQNVIILLSLALNAFAAYLLAFDRTGQFAPSLVAGIIFGGSPYISAHLLGHFNLIGAWGLPLFALFLLRAWERSSFSASTAAGICLVAVAYTDYYYFVYCLALGGCLLGWRLRPKVVSVHRRSVSRGFRYTVVLLLLADAAAVAVVARMHGGVVGIGPIRISLSGTANLFSFAWLVVMTWALVRYRLSVTWQAIQGADLFRLARPLALAGAIAVVGMLPLLSHGARLWLHGDYVSPRHLWRTGAAGIDVASLLLGNPSHPIWGAWVRRAYASLGLDRVEGVGWLGVAPLGLVCLAGTRYRNLAETKLWLGIATVFFIWALGPWLSVAGFNTGLILPENFFAFIPVLGNARMPGRAVSVVFLAIAVLAAVVLSQREFSGRRGLVAAILAAIVVDYLPAPFPTTALDVPSIYQTIRANDAGSTGIVCELPLGLRDGFGGVGRFEDSALIAQMVHQHPILGGFAARLPSSLAARYQQIPVIRSLLRLSAGQAANDGEPAGTPTEATEMLRHLGVAFVVLDRSKATDALVSYVHTALDLTPVSTDGVRELYTIPAVRTASTAPVRPTD